MKIEPLKRAWQRLPPMVRFIVPASCALMPFALLTGTSIHCSSQKAEGSEYIARVRDRALEVQGGFDAVLVGMVEKAIRSADGPITKIRINSVGGQEEALNQIRTLFSKLGNIPIEVPDKMICQSACVGVLAHASGPVEVGPAATLMFHAGAKRYGLASTGLCGGLNRVSVAISSYITPQSTRRTMLPWAAALSDDLPRLFALCKVHPLDSDQGMSLSGDEFNALKKGEMKPEDLLERCPSY